MGAPVHVSVHPTLLLPARGDEPELTANRADCDWRKSTFRTRNFYPALGLIGGSKGREFSLDRRLNEIISAACARMYGMPSRG